MGLFLESTGIEVLTALVVLSWAFYAYVTEKYTYWRDRGVPHAKPSFPFGCMGDLFFGRKPLGEVFEMFYKQFEGERYFGVYESRRPTLVIRDPELIKRIMTKDFQYFSDRFTIPINKKTDYISLHLFNMTGKEWKRMRLKLAPTFTSGRMKAMHLLMDKCGEQLREYVAQHVKVNPDVDVKDVLARFTMDIIATCALGLEINSLSDKECEFYHFGIQIFQPSVNMMVKRVLFTLIPPLSRFVSIRFTPEAISDFLTRIVRDTVEYREKNNITRNDFLDLLIKIRDNKNLLEDEVISNGSLKSQPQNSFDKLGLTLEEMTAQAFVFFAAGFETASSTMSFCLYELARHQELQEKLYQEITQVLAKHNGQLSYQAVQEMLYMDQVVNETLRLYGSLPILYRMCTEPYRLPGTDIVLEKGQRVVIPTYAIHHDPQYYPNPLQFDPDRFAENEVKQRHAYTHLPFGEGPRICIGMRFGLLQTKIGLTEMISNFKFEPTVDTQIPIVIHKRSFVTQPELPIMLKLSKRTLDL